MKTWLPLLILFFTWSLVINVMLKDSLDKLTGYKDWAFHALPNWFIWTFMFFGIFMFPFYKQIKEYRKTYYISREVQIYEQWYRMHRNMGTSLTPTMTSTSSYDARDKEKYELYVMNKRYLKLKRLQKNSKRIWRQFHL